MSGAAASPIPAGVRCADDWITHARARLDPDVYAWLAGGAARTFLDNRMAFDRRRLLPRMLADVAGGDTRVELFGDLLAHPFLLAPVGHQTLLHPEGELASARGAAAMGAGMVAATLSGFRLEDIAACGVAPLWFQLYWQPRREDTLALVRRAEAVGCRALVLTVDLPIAPPQLSERIAGRLPRIPANLAGMAPSPSFTAMPGGPGPLQSPLLAAAPRWDDVAWLEAQTRLPLLLKGVLHPDDARRALALGLDGLIVSNHGARTVDRTVASLDALPAVAAAVAGRVPVLFDGGIHDGSEALIARALGADAVLIGRAAMYALAVAGAPGVAHVLHLLRTELEMAMALVGCGRWLEAGPGILFSD
ncbi:alpha-hydroxy acid oxidase [Arenimonas composti]|uniref:FMN hydroxy acid dehydrogenase domain-containing protein n=1 Tax=Arenimonas composti TR7-09 = DSM 18010 TaxID=1121013 RepID=A0A091BHJ7_9GAMM|nr:alpha-hydroxy acid oxidase [Arenimonas composti]KFN50967.1 hypothetical protein P873_05010 [Arenimonas composti TR7-09 = DSM 18010]